MKGQEKLTFVELRKLAGKYKIAGRSSMNKKQLMAALKDFPEVEKVVQKKAASIKVKTKKSAKKSAKKGVAQVLTPGVTSGSQKKSAPKITAPVLPDRKPYIDNGPPLPSDYGDNRLVTMVRDPGCIYIYWEVAQEKLADFQKQIGHKNIDSGKWCLQVFRDEQLVAEEVIRLDANSWYIDVPQAEMCLVEMGIKTSDDVFHSFLNAKEVGIPRQEPEYEENLWASRDDKMNLTDVDYKAKRIFPSFNKPGDDAPSSAVLAGKSLSSPGGGWQHKKK